MSETDWEQRYQTGDMPWEKGEASPGLVDFLQGEALAEFLRKHKPESWLTVAVPGCGTGHDVRAWSKAGFAACGFDLAPSAVEIARERTAAAGLNAKFATTNFLTDEPPFLFDWVFEHTLFCAINPGERENYVRAAARWLKPGGNYVAVNYLIPDTEGPPFGTTREELVKRFSPHFELLSDWVPRSYENRKGLERMMWWRKAEPSSMSTK